MQNEIDNIHKLERQLVFLLNLDNWRLEWTGEGYESYDAKGFDPSGKSCVIEFKFRSKAYAWKMLEKYKYDKLIEEKTQKKYYAVVDHKGVYIFDLGKITTTTEFIDCPKTTSFDQGDNTKRQKEVFMLGRENKWYNYKF